MLDWMQRHKKYLVITVWVSVIALVAAGVVGWGANAFSFGHPGSVARVGDIYISQEEYQNEYQNVMSTFSQNGPQIDDTEAKSLGLDKIALDRLISEALIRSYAQKLGIKVTPEQIRGYLQNIPEFQTNGVFDPQKYKDYVASTHRKPSELESQIATELLRQTMISISLFPASSYEVDAFLSAFNIKDELELKYLDASSMKVSASQDEIKKYWEAHKSAYTTPIKYDVAYINIDADSLPISDEEIKHFYEENKFKYLDSNGEVLPYDKAKDRVILDAKKQLASSLAKFAEVYLKTADLSNLKANTKDDTSVIIDASKSEIASLKNARDNGVDITKGSIKVHVLSFDENTKVLSPAIVASIDKLHKTNSKLLEPHANGDSYITLSILDSKDKEPLSFELAQDAAKKDLLVSKRASYIKEVANKELKNLNGLIDFGLVSANDASKININGLSKQDITTALRDIFQSHDKKGIVWLANNTKALIYNIKSQQLPSYSELMHLVSSSGSEQVQQLKTSMILDSLIRHAELHSKVTRY
ncbi:hypothetical protein BKH43_01395 [Helicobacter sp. 13S00401-1]|uniref:peptidylprolyl isomerase n=1 Tax=Helicobacter sp. 13S00401-1 TaxID=1905758 RepID=UPI000BA7306E|nr:peptidylprolyl isomerase [Helicobacter sp. 13S00401-1]PAF51321.1 hypothetical protein BKH43_01395 [Helicobacter sp. 13S00401-1]